MSFCLSLSLSLSWWIFVLCKKFVNLNKKIFASISSDLSHSETRLSVFLDGFEFHVYNRSQTYAHLEKLFGLVPNIIPEQPESEAETKARYSGARSLTPLCIDSAVDCVWIICYLDSLHLFIHGPVEKIRFPPLQKWTLLPVMIALFLQICLACDASW